MYVLRWDVQLEDLVAVLEKQHDLERGRGQTHVRSDQTVLLVLDGPEMGRGEGM